METTLTEARIRAMTAAGHWPGQSLEAYLDRWARERPPRTALVDGRGRDSWEDLAGGEGPAGTAPLGALTDQAWEARDDRRPLPGTDPNAVHEVVFTSGTTGEPKGVMHTQNTTLSGLHRAIERLELSDRDVILMPSTV